MERTVSTTRSRSPDSRASVSSSSRSSVSRPALSSSVDRSVIRISSRPPPGVAPLRGHGGLPPEARKGRPAPGPRRPRPRARSGIPSGAALLGQGWGGWRGPRRPGLGGAGVARHPRALLRRGRSGAGPEPFHVAHASLGGRTERLCGARGSAEVLHGSFPFLRPGKPHGDGVSGTPDGPARCPTPGEMGKRGRAIGQTSHKSTPAIARPPTRGTAPENPPPGARMTGERSPLNRDAGSPGAGPRAPSGGQSA